MFVVAGSSEPLRNHPDNGAAFKTDAFWRFINGQPHVEHIRTRHDALETNAVVERAAELAEEPAS
jgi:hypothetical protein